MREDIDFAELEKLKRKNEYERKVQKKERIKRKRYEEKEYEDDEE